MESIPTGSGPRFASLAYRDFRLFLTGQLVSFSGTWMHVTAQGWLVYELTRSPLYLGVVSAASSLPILMFTLLGGVVADRSPKRRLLIITQAASVLPVLAIAVLTSTGHVTVWHVMAMAFILGSINSLDIPTRQSFLVEMVERGNLMNAIALNSAVFNGARMVGPVLGGIAIAAFGVATCFYLNAASFLAVVLALALIRAKGEPHPDRVHASVRAEINDGVRFIRHEPAVLRPILLVSAVSLFGLPFVSLMPVFAEDVLGVGARGLGYLMGASGVGAFCSALAMAYFAGLQGNRRVMLAASLVFPSALMVFSQSRSYPLSLVLMFVTGVSVVLFLANANGTIQLRSPDGMRGRVMSVYTVVFLGMAPIGQSMIGFVAHAVGTPRAVFLSASACLCMSVCVRMIGRGAAETPA